MKAIKIFGLGLVFFLLRCSSLRNTSSAKISYSKFMAVKVGEATVEEVKQVFGPPDNTYYLGKENQIVEKSDKRQWSYKDKNLNKLYLYFEADVLVSKSWNVDDEDQESSTEKVLREIDGDWIVVKEPMTNPHAGPTQCYLEDLKEGKMVKVHGYKKNVSEISVWRPSKGEKSIKERLHSNVGKEFCIANSCARIIDPEAWKHNHCEWLEQLIANQKNHK